jgi:hypothetical protein
MAGECERVQNRTDLLVRQLTGVLVVDRQQSARKIIVVWRRMWSDIAGKRPCSDRAPRVNLGVI